MIDALQVTIIIFSGALVIYVLATEIRRRVYLARRGANAPGAAQSKPGDAGP